MNTVRRGTSLEEATSDPRVALAQVAALKQAFTTFAKAHPLLEDDLKDIASILFPTIWVYEEPRRVVVDVAGTMIETGAAVDAS